MVIGSETPDDRTLLRPQPSSARAAREFVGDALHRRGADAVRDTVMLLTSELVTNAIIHAGTEVDLALIIGDKKVRVEVGDGSDSLPTPRRSPPDVVGGHGLELVNSLSCSWGVANLGRGKKVWFEVDCPPRDREERDG